jgi:predicted ATPase
MKLRSAHIRHYKSLDDVEVKFSDGITVLVGPNAVGKSNVVDALRFVRDAMASNLEHAISTRGGITRVRQFSRTKPYKLSIQLNFSDDHDETGIGNAGYEFSVESLSSTNYVVGHELATSFVKSRETKELEQAILTRTRSGMVAFKGEEKGKVALDQLAQGLGSPFAPMGWQLTHFMTGWGFSAIYPNRLREPSTPDRDSDLAEDGRNWASVIKALRRTVRGRQALERVSDAMRVVIPSFQDVAVSTVGSYLVPAFSFAQGSTGKVVFDPVQLSDGTLRIFGILLALYQTPAPSLLVIEEPEQTVHPGVLGVLADAFREAAETTQLIITTHSPNLIDYFAPEEVRVVSLEGGLTKVGHIKRSQVEAVKQRLMSMQEFMLAEGLAPEGA